MKYYDDDDGNGRQWHDDDDKGDDDGTTTMTITMNAMARRATGYNDNGKDNGGGR